MNPFQMRRLSGLVFALVLAPAAIGCGSGVDVEDIHGTIDGRASTIQTYTTSFFPVDNMTPTLFLSSSEGGPCGPAPNEAWFNARVQIEAIQATPVGTPIDVNVEKSGVEVTLDAGVGSCGVREVKPNNVRGTVTFTHISEWHAVGSIDLRLDGALAECGFASPTTIEYKWDSFIASDYNHEGCE